MTRKLATIQRIKDLVAIEGADRIEIAIINGWQVVTQKGTHAVGDLVIFYEIDSFLPSSDPRYASFSDRFINWGDKHGMRLKTIKLRKQLSQGLIMPVREFPELEGIKQPHDEFEEGDDVTELLNIEKWEPIEKDVPGRIPSSSNGKRFPAFIRKTDQERIQNYGEMAFRALDEEFEVTVKKDGSSVTVFRVDPSSPHYKDAKALSATKLSLWQKIKAFFSQKLDEPVYGICSRNVLLPLEGNSNFHKAAAPALATLRFHTGCLSIAIQGEVVAPDIQENYEKVSDVELHIFDIFDINKQTYLTPLVRRVFVSNYNLNHATVVAEGTLRSILKLMDADVTADSLVKYLLTYASGPGDNKGVMREGVVFKANERDFSFKAVSNEYLLKTGK